MGELLRLGAIGAVLTAGLLFTLAAARGVRIFPALPDIGEVTSAIGLPLLVAAAVGIPVAVLSGWPAAGLSLGCLAAWIARSAGMEKERQGQIDRTEAIATWVEQLRDGIVAASGLEQVIRSTRDVAPEAIAPEVRRLGSALEHEPTTVALDRFGDDLDHPSGDLVVASLRIASTREARDLNLLLNRLAPSIRDDARMRVRVAVGRAKLRSTGQMMVIVMVAVGAGLTLFGGDYLDVYDSFAGQIVLGVAGLFAASSLFIVEYMGKTTEAQRFLRREKELV